MVSGLDNQGGKEQELLCCLYDALGSAYTEKADFEEKAVPHLATDYQRKALKLRLKIYGEMHIDTSTSYHNLGATMVGTMGYLVFQNDTITEVDMTESAQALEYLQKSLEIKKTFLDENHTNIKEAETLISLLGKIHCVLGIRHLEKGEEPRMIEMLKKGVDIMESVDNQNEYAFIEGICYILGLSLKEKGAYGECIMYLEKALKLSDSLNDKQEFTSILKELDKTYLAWIDADPDNKDIQRQYLLLKNKHLQNN